MTFFIIAPQIIGLIFEEKLPPRPLKLTQCGHTDWHSQQVFPYRFNTHICTLRTAHFPASSLSQEKKYILKYFFLNGPTPASFSFIFGLFKQTLQFLQ